MSELAEIVANPPALKSSIVIEACVMLDAAKIKPKSNNLVWTLLWEKDNTFSLVFVFIRAACVQPF